MPSFACSHMCSLCVVAGFPHDIDVSVYTILMNRKESGGTFEIPSQTMSRRLTMPNRCFTNIDINTGSEKMDMCSCDGSAEKREDGTIDEIVALVWDGPGRYGIESFVPGVRSIDILCFDKEGLKCELDDMFPDGMDWHDADIRKC